MASNQSSNLDQGKQQNVGTGGYVPEDDFKDTGEYQSDQVHEVLVSSHRIPPDKPRETNPDEKDVDTGEYQSDQVRQVHNGKH
jgi:hypothetical protein